MWQTEAPILFKISGNHAKVKAVKKTSNQIYCKIRCDALE